MIIRAEMRMATEIDRGQEAGDVRARADNQHVRSSDKHGLADLGISRQRVAEWWQTRDAGETGRLLGSHHAPLMLPQPLQADKNSLLTG